MYSLYNQQNFLLQTARKGKERSYYPDQLCWEGSVQAHDEAKHYTESIICKQEKKKKS